MKYRYYNPTSATWSEELYSLDDLAKDAYFTDETMLATEDGQRTLTYKQAMQNIVGRGKCPKPKPKTPTARNDIKLTSVTPITCNDEDQKYTNYWIRLICKWLLFFILSGLYCLVLSFLLRPIMWTSEANIFGCLLGFVFAWFSMRRVDDAAKKHAAL